MPILQSKKKNHFLSNDYFSQREDNKILAPEQNSNIGSLGGEISSELGFTDLEAARDYAESFKPWNSEEWEMVQDQIRQQSNQKKIPNSSEDLL